MKRALICLALSVCLVSPGWAAPEADAKTALVSEYFSYIPMKTMMDEMTMEISKQVPAEKRQQFIDTMTNSVRLGVLEATARQSLAKHFTVAELQLFVDFIKRPEGRSAMGKMKYYMADLMPVLQQEMFRAIKASTPQPEK
jgi:hypothetical protein